jgi:hypothetical protein
MPGSSTVNITLCHAITLYALADDVEGERDFRALRTAVGGLF